MRMENRIKIESELEPEHAHYVNYNIIYIDSIKLRLCIENLFGFRGANLRRTDQSACAHYKILDTRCHFEYILVHLRRVWSLMNETISLNWLENNFHKILWTSRCISYNRSKRSVDFIIIVIGHTHHTENRKATISLSVFNLTFFLFIRFFSSNAWTKLRVSNEKKISFRTIVFSILWL